MTGTRRILPFSPKGGFLRRASLALSAGIALAGLATAPPAQARVGVFFGFSPFVAFPPAFYYPAPVFYPPPFYYAPPWVVYAPPVTYTPPATGGQAYAPGSRGRSCYAGAYVCPMNTPVAAGATCWCPDNAGRRAYGRAG